MGLDQGRPLGPEVKETRKRKREIVLSVALAALFLVLSWLAFRLTEDSRRLPFVYSIFFFGLVNFNIVLLLFLLFLIFRNVVKIFVERPGRYLGSTLKGKLVAAFVTFSFVPTALMFLISVFYINSSFDKWFSVKMAGVLKDSLEITNDYYRNAKKRNYHFAHEISHQLESENPRDLPNAIRRLRKLYSLDAVELYPTLFDNRSMALSEDENLPSIPRVALEFLQKGVTQRIDASTIHNFGDGNLIRVIVPVNLGRGPGTQSAAIVVSSFVPISLINKMDEIAAAYDDFRDLNPLEYPLKSIYLIILILVTLVILFGATWFGFHLARQLSTPLESLAQAARRISRGKYGAVDIRSGSLEINQLVASFNQMTSDLKRTLDTLDEHGRYIEVVLSNVSAGVISTDAKGVISTLNRRAGRLLKLNPADFIGKPAREFLSDEHKIMIDGILENLIRHRAPSIRKEVRVDVAGETMLMQMTLSLLRDEAGNDLGIVLVFDDLTMLVNAQRASAWREVARRIAHEIKNPLTPIKLSAQRLEKKFGVQIGDPAFLTCTSTIIKQVDELRDMVNEFSNFARLPQSQPISGDLNQTIEESLVLYREGHKDIEFLFSPDTLLPLFDFDPEQLKRVVGNLAVNVVQALQESSRTQGRIEISTHYDSILGIVRIIFRDNGPGIPEEVRSRIFEPYFSTKKMGTGLGLAIVKRIIDDHNGFIRAYANDGGGTKFIIELPLVRVPVAR